MFAGLDRHARDIAGPGAVEEARVLRHPAVDVEHLLLALARASVLAADHARLQGRVISRRGVGSAAPAAWMPYAPAAVALLRGPRPVDLLLGVLETGVAGELLGEELEPARAQAVTLAQRPDEPSDLDARIRGGWPVPVYLGGDLPIGDLGHPRTDARVLLAILAAGRRGADVLRAHGLDEAALRAALPADE
ncbi:MAG TPA: Clp protease N-terminal domain-containing protein [Solirubrobacter sp.]|nr:Clp protease N-terminal domain-containing protein [Solirubrobacter sp.]